MWRIEFLSNTKILLKFSWTFPLYIPYLYIIIIIIIYFYLCVYILSIVDSPRFTLQCTTSPPVCSRCSLNITRMQHCVHVMDTLHYTLHQNMACLMWSPHWWHMVQAHVWSQRMASLHSTWVHKRVTHIWWTCCAGVGHSQMRDQRYTYMTNVIVIVVVVLFENKYLLLHDILDDCYCHRYCYCSSFRK